MGSGSNDETRRIDEAVAALGELGTAEAPRPRPGRGGDRRIVAIAGGKGGTGKSVVAVTLAVELAGRGLDVVLVDGDLGGPNLHSLLAMPFPKAALSDFILRRADTLAELAVPTPVPRLSLISGARNAQSVASPMHQQKLRLIRALLALPADVVVIDLGAGSHPNVVDFFLAARHGIMVVAPEPTAVENAYRFLKAAFLRNLRLAETGDDFKALLLQATQTNDGRAMAPAELVDAIARQDPEAGERLRRHVATFRPLLLVNRARDARDLALGEGMCAAASRLFGVEIGYVGHLHHSVPAEMAIRARLPLVGEHLGREMEGELAAIATRLLAMPVEPEAVA